MVEGVVVVERMVEIENSRVCLNDCEIIVDFQRFYVFLYHKLLVYYMGQAV